MKTIHFYRQFVNRQPANYDLYQDKHLIYSEVIYIARLCGRCVDGGERVESNCGRCVKFDILRRSEF